MGTIRKVARTLVVVGVIGGLAALGAVSAFTSQTDNPGNSAAGAPLGRDLDQLLHVELSSAGRTVERGPGVAATSSAGAVTHSNSRAGKAIFAASGLAPGRTVAGSAAASSTPGRCRGWARATPAGSSRAVRAPTRSGPACPRAVRSTIRSRPGPAASATCGRPERHPEGRWRIGRTKRVSALVRGRRAQARRWVRLQVGLNRAARRAPRRALLGGRRTTLRLFVVAADRAGNERLARRRIVFRRAR